ncbi:glycoside hydrolase family 88 protein [Paenibacillus sp. LHD-117]|uniref:glycoside hydrolase family 88/105 protein n=1 Tax=Paenibacillus sp. LHD-117 TaxID=3071412 RepID=UPI0027E1B460|nr:glycoside hydrolase family 88 protein [Paenibacillus sp. LHD-117]MDQ6420164.1 glycoside hydrolase family 88 protein [Paenibacillus sp. LHD-117]
MTAESVKEQADRVYRFMTAGRYREWGMDIDHWDWVPGVGVISIMEYGILTRHEPAIAYVSDWVERNGEKAARKRVINSMAPFAVFPDLYRHSGNRSYDEQSSAVARWMLEEAPRTREGAFEHTVTEPASFPEQVWADTAFMAVVFLARFAGLSGDRKVAEEALAQSLVHLRLLQDDDTGVLFHGWDCGSGNHMSAARWTRANAWVALAIPEIAMNIGGLVEIPEEFRERYGRLAAGLRSYQSADGLWHTVLDRPGFYKETSGSAGIACGFLKGVRAGLLEASYLQAGARTVEGLLPFITSEGEVTSVSGGTPVMPSIEAYNTIPLIPTLYGQGLTLMLLAETASLLSGKERSERK